MADSGVSRFNEIKAKDLESLSKLSVSELLKFFDSDINRGLNNKEVSSRRAFFGSNSIPEKEETFLQRLKKRLWNPIAWMLEFAAVLSLLAGKTEDFFIILILLVVNIGLDMFQEGKALNALKALKKKLPKRAVVLRNGKFYEINSEELVPGDIVKLKIGDIIPADVMLIKGDFIELDQSSLTGESTLVLKKAGEIAYGNSIVKKGEMLALVLKTGVNTYFGKTVMLTEKASLEKQSHLQKTIIKVGNFLMYLAIALIVIIILAGIEKGDSLIEIIRFSLVLMVSSIPVALPTVLTVTLAAGALVLSKKDAIVKRLSSIEELAGVDILCVDKTGTITKNELTISEPFLLGKHTKQDLIFFAALSSREENNDPLEAPIFNELKKLSAYKKFKKCKQLNFIPFDPVRKRTEALVSCNNKKFYVTKGAPQVVMALTHLKGKEKELVERKVEEYAENGFRTIAVAIKTPKDSRYSFVGLIPLYDPLREDSKEAVEEAKKYGLNIKMITGDNYAIAKYITKILGIGDNVLHVKEIKEDEMQRELEFLAELLSKTLYKKFKPKSSKREVEDFAREVVIELEKQISNYPLRRGFVQKHESEIIEIIENASAFSEVFPQDKYFIVKELQKAFHMVAMTGDGVNDAPALKKADVGIAVFNASDAAKSAADLILLTPGIKVIIDAITLSRETFEKMRSYTVFRIAETIRILFFMTFAILVFNFYPLTPLMIILLALLNDIPILGIAYDNVKISQKPVRWNMKKIFTLSAVLGFTGVASSFILLFIVKDVLALPIALIQSIIFAKLVVAGHGTIYNTRTEDWFWKKPWPSSILFNATFWSRIAGTLIAVFGFGLVEPIGFYWGIFIWAYSILWFMINDLAKMLTLKVMREKKTLFRMKHPVVKMLNP